MKIQSTTSKWNRQYQKEKYKTKKDRRQRRQNIERKRKNQKEGERTNERRSMAYENLHFQCSTRTRFNSFLSQSQSLSLSHLLSFTSVYVFVFFYHNTVYVYSIRRFFLHGCRSIPLFRWYFCVLRSSGKKCAPVAHLLPVHAILKNLSIYPNFIVCILWECAHIFTRIFTSA